MSLARMIKKQIVQSGPITLADYMALCLMHPKHGYYTQERVFGSEGDFITAPEISQMFGEMIAAHVVERWQAMGRPNPVRLIELGPGRGTLMADILRTLDKVPDLTGAIQPHFVEISPQLRDLQKKAVAQANWHDDLRDIPDGPAIVIANEFLDALPIHQFVYTEKGWQERLVSVVDDRLITGLGAVSNNFALALMPEEAPTPGDILEVCPGISKTLTSLSDRAKTNPTSALFIDYGYARAAFGDSFQAVQQHDYVDPFEAPGKADLTSHVNFAAITDSARRLGLRASAIVCQGDWLMAMGIGHRAMMLSDGKSTAVRQNLLSDLKRLTAPDEMGELFKVITLSSAGISLPAVGFSPQPTQSGLNA